MTDFLTSLKSLLAEHGYYLSGTVRLIPHSDQWDAGTFEIAVAQERHLYGGIDRTGPFLTATVQPIPPVPVDCRTGKSFHVNPDIGGYECPVTGRWIGSRRAHGENLKRTGCRNLEPGESREARKRQDEAVAEGCKRTARELVASIAHQIEV